MINTIKNKLKEYESEIIGQIQTLIRFESTEGEALPNMPFGKPVHHALEHVLTLAASMGFKTKNLNGYAGYAEIGEGQDLIGILVHIDVVPAGEGWSFPPFEGTVHEGRLYGRGASDDKGPAVACLYAMRIIKELCPDLSKRIRIIFGTNEETSWQGIDYYKEHEELPGMGFTPDADFPVIFAEKGILNIKLDFDNSQFNTNNIEMKVQTLKGGIAVNSVPEKAEVCVLTDAVEKLKMAAEKLKTKDNRDITVSRTEKGCKITARGKAAHGSTPDQGCNAISILMSLLKASGLRSNIAPVIDFYHQRIGMGFHGQGMQCDFEDQVSGKLTLNVGLVDINENAATLDLDIRYPVSVKKNDVISCITQSLENNMSLSVQSHIEPVNQDINSPLIKILMETYQTISRDKTSKPISIGGGTYARSMKNIVAFGPLFPGEKETAHGKDEYIVVENLMRAALIYTHALYRLVYT